MLLTLLACLAHHQPQVTWASHHEALPPALVEVFATQDHDAVFEEAVARRKSGDTEGAIQRLAWLERQNPGDFAVLYQLGLAYEARGDFEAALTVYDRMAGDDPQGSYALDWGFRRALCLEELGQYEEALAEYRALPVPADGQKAATLALATEVAALEAGRGSIRSVEKAIDRASHDPWMCAKAHVAIATHLLDESKGLEFDVGQRRQVKHLKARAGLIVDAESHIAAAVRLEQVEWILRGMLALGDAYADLADDLEGSRPPRGADPSTYGAALEQKSQVIRAKAYTAYDQGLVVAGRFAVQGELPETLKSRRDGLDL